jgi:hypothetical protein
MNRKLLLSFAGASAAVVMAVGTAQAAPGSSAGDVLRSYAQEQSTVEDVRWRRRHCHTRCWWHRGHRHCRRVCNRRGW